MKKSFGFLVSMMMLPASASIITFDDFSSTDGLQLNSGAHVVSGSNVMRFGGSGSVYTQDKVSLASDVSFSSKFTFNFNNQINGGADGLMFILQTQNNTVGGGGGGIGFAGLNNSFGIEFDNWNNGIIDDHSDSHLGININGNVDSIVTRSTYSLGLGNLDNGLVDWTSWIEYNGATNQLEVFFNNIDLKPQEAAMSLSIDIAAALGSNEAYVGFASATGYASANHDLKSFYFADSYTDADNIAKVSEPATLSLLVLGLLAALRRKIM